MKNKSLNLGSKLPYLVIFRLTFGKKKSAYLKQFRTFQDAKFRTKLEILKFRTKIALLGVLSSNFKETIVIFTQNKKH